VMVRHDAYGEIDLGRLREWLARPSREVPPVLVDGRRVFDRDKAQAAGFVFRGVGMGG